MKNRFYRIIFLLIVYCMSIQCAWGDISDGMEVCQPLEAGQKESLTLVPWKEGFLDIHFINTGKGESTFYILPDGTTMLVDAASSLIKPEEILPKPDGSKRPSQWIIEYISKVALQSNTKKIDYFLLTHYDSDHIGGYDESLPAAGNGSYRLNGAAEILDYYNVGTLIDRAWPSYDYPKKLNSKAITNYRNSAKFQQKKKRLKIEKFRPGTTGQIILKHAPSAYVNFEIRNLVVNGEIWTGKGEKTRKNFPEIDDITKDNMPTENHLSTAFRLSYGKFNYYAGGDLSFRDRDEYEWKDIEKPIGSLTGNVEVMKANHHGSYDANDSAFLKALDPDVILIHVWRTVQPRTVTLHRMATMTSADIFATNLDKNYAHDYGNDITRIKDNNVHIIVRVYPGGEHYDIYTIDDTDKEYRIKHKFGPYICH